MTTRTTIPVTTLADVTALSVTAVTAALGGQFRNDGNTILYISGTAADVVTIRANLDIGGQDVEDKVLAIPATAFFTQKLPTRIFNFANEMVHVDLTTGTTVNIMAIRA